VYFKQQHQQRRKPAIGLAYIHA